MYFAFWIISRILAIAAGSCVVIFGTLFVGQRQPQPGMIVSVMQSVPSGVLPRQSAPFLRFIDVERGVSAIRRPPVEGLLAIQSSFAPQPTFWLITNTFSGQNSSVTTTSGFHYYDALAQTITTIYENTVSGYEPVSSPTEYRFSQSFPGGGIIFFEPSERAYYLLSPGTGDKLRLLEVPAGTITQLWFSRDHTRFAYIRDGHLVMQDLYGGNLREYPEITLSNAHLISWEDNDQALLITSNTDTDGPKYYIDVETGESVNPAIADITGRGIRFQPACGPGILSYSGDSGQLFMGDLKNNQWWTLVPEELIPSHEILRVSLLPGCTGALIEAGAARSGRYEPINIYLSDVYGQDVRLIREHVFIYQRPDINGDYIYGTKTESGRLRLYSANLYDNNNAEFVRELPDLSAFGSVTILDDRLVFTSGNYLTATQLAWININNEKRVHMLTPLDETVLSYRYYPPQEK